MNSYACVIGCGNGIYIRDGATVDIYLQTVAGWTQDLAGDWLCPRCAGDGSQSERTEGEYPEDTENGPSR